MAISNPTTLKTYFQTGDRPTQSQFDDLIDTSIRPTMEAICTAVEVVGKLGVINVTAAGPGFIVLGSAGRSLMTQSNMAIVKDLTWPYNVEGGIYGRFNDQNTVLVPGSADTILHGGSAPSYSKIVEGDIELVSRVVGGIVIHDSAEAISVIAAASVNKVLTGQGPTALPVYLDMYEYLGQLSSYELLNIPSWINKLKFVLNGISNTSGNIGIQIGDSTAYAASGYISQSSRPGASVSQTTMMGITASPNAASAHYGIIELHRMLPNANTWIFTGLINDASTGQSTNSSGIGSLSGSLTRAKFITSSGSLDAGTVHAWGYV